MKNSPIIPFLLCRCMAWIENIDMDKEMLRVQTNTLMNTMKCS